MQALLRWLDPILNPEACLPPLELPAMAGENVDALLKRLDLLLRKQVRYSLSGERRSRLKGQGLDFSGLREYAPGDDIRKMDWSVFARTLTPYVREYQEEKQLTLWLAVDLTPSMHFGRRQTKARQTLELAGIMALLAQSANHQLGALIILADGCRVIPPKASPGQAKFLLNTMLEHLEKPAAPEPLTALNAERRVDPFTTACQQLGHVVRKQHTVILLSDFLTQTQDWQAPLGELSRQAQLLCFMVADPVECSLPSGLGLLTLTDPETGHTIQVDTNDPALCRLYEQEAHTQQLKRLEVLRKMGVATVALTDTDPMRTLLALLSGQERTP